MSQSLDADGKLTNKHFKTRQKRQRGSSSVALLCRSPQFCCLLLFFLNFRPVQQVRPTQNLGSVGLNFKTGQLGKRYVKATEIPFFI